MIRLDPMQRIAKEVTTSLYIDLVHPLKPKTTKSILRLASRLKAIGILSKSQSASFFNLLLKYLQFILISPAPSSSQQAAMTTEQTHGGVRGKMTRGMTEVRGIYNNSLMPMSGPSRTSSNTAKSHIAPAAATVSPNSIHVPSPIFSRNHAFKIVKGTAKYAARSVTDMASMVGQNPKLTLAALGLMLVGKRFYEGRRLQPYQQLLRTSRKKSSKGHRNRAQNGQNRTKARRSRIIKTETPSVTESRTRTRKKTRHMVVDVGDTRVHLSTPSSPDHRGTGDESTPIGDEHVLTPDVEMEDSDSSVPEMTEEQEEKKKELKERHARYTGRLSRREKILLKCRDEWLKADEASTKAEDTLDQAQRAFDQCCEGLVRAESKMKKVVGSRDLVKQQLDDVKRQQEDLQLEIDVEWE